MNSIILSCEKKITAMMGFNKEHLSIEKKIWQCDESEVGKCGSNVDSEVFEQGDVIYCMILHCGKAFLHFFHLRLDL